MHRLGAAAALLSVTAAGLLGAMLVVALSAGVTQQKFEHVAAMPGYLAAFSAARAPMLLTLSFDNLFILAYAGAIALGMAALRTSDTAWPAVAAAVGIVATGLLDYAENLHFLTLYATLDAGGTPTVEEIASRMWQSLMKWHIAYASLFAVSFVLPARGVVAWTLVWSLRVVLPVVGVLVYTAPSAWQPWLTLSRYLLMLVGFVMFSLVFFEQSRRTP